MFVDGYYIDDAELRALERRMRTAEQNCLRDLSEAIYGYGEDRRVYDLRRSVLGEEAGPAPDCLRGLREVLP